MTSSARHTWRRKAVYAGILCICSIALLEVGVRLANRIRHGRWTALAPEQSAANSGLYVGHVWLGQMPRPGATIIADGRRISVNRFGYRGRDFDLVKPAGTLRIACIGGSTTFDIKVGDDGKTWPAQLETILRAQYGCDGVDVVNAATNGYALPRTIIDLALRTLDIQPDWVICYPGVNDLAYCHRPCHEWGQSQNAIVQPAHPSLWEQMLPNSELYNEITARIRYARQLRYGNWEGEPIQRQDFPDPRGIAAFERNLATLAGICQAHNIRLALVTVRTAYDPGQPADVQERLAAGDLRDHPYLSLAGHYTGYRKINDLIRRAADRYGLFLIDQAADMPSDATHFADSVHFNDDGARAFAVFTAARLAPRLPPDALALTEQRPR